MICSSNCGAGYVWDNETALMFATACGGINIVEILLLSNASTDAKDAVSLKV